MTISNIDIISRENLQPNQDPCPEDALIVHDGETAGAPVLATICGSHAKSKTITGTTNKLFIMFASTKQKKNAKGFQVKFYSTSSAPRQPPSLIPIAKEDFSTVDWANLEEDFECDFDGSEGALETCNMKQWQLRDNFDFIVAEGGTFSRNIGRDTGPTGGVGGAGSKYVYSRFRTFLLSS